MKQDWDYRRYCADVTFSLPTGTLWESVEKDARQWIPTFTYITTVRPHCASCKCFGEGSPGFRTLHFEFRTPDMVTRKIINGWVSEIKTVIVEHGGIVK